MKTIDIGILGLGTVGSGVVKILQDNAQKITDITGCKLNVKTVVVRDVTAKRNVDLTGIELTDDFTKLVTDDDIKIVVEVMGTVETARGYIKQLLNSKKHVVTANKDLIAQHGPELSELAKQNHCDLFYEASVAGGIPILRTIVNSFAADQVESVLGIVNGTTNFILTQMTQNGLSYAQALKLAQEKGFAEADPTNDVKGKDAAYKMIILTQFAFGKDITVDDVKLEGIDGVQLADINEAAQLGYTIKLLGIAKLIDDKLDVSVGPVLVPSSRPLAAIQNENNAVLVTGKAVGETMFYGPGAGELPTANSVLSDIIAVTKDIVLETTGSRFNGYVKNVALAPASDVIYPYYLSLVLPDKPGQMLKLTEIMAKQKASFNVIKQTGESQGTARISLVTHAMTEAQLNAIKAELKEMPEMQLLAAYKVLEG
ncbi:MAG: homoserine dehydrogenase [Ligilactobacillus animalis]|uniref:homoserine dehydrogenase n=1 Tax=Ligilactobacillus animalis TaxID=1605 RepID=UPI00242A345F|nr:homoserine dehydrogenase [Ligilactobacillus animalis]MCI5942888.1 homoserine dehydrogenase [Ligilactobacillus animalis]MDY2992556.1 homoserine dehydrogenase [Ligilactobacillus animalis]